MAFLAALLVVFLLYPVLSFLPILGPLLTGVLAGLVARKAGSGLLAGLITREHI